MGSPELRRGAAATLAEQIAAWLRKRIRAGEFEPDNDPLPSESQMVGDLGVSRPTVRRAVEILRAEGLVYTRPQVGTFVRAEAITQECGGQRPALGLFVPLVMLHMVVSQHPGAVVQLAHML